MPGGRPPKDRWRVDRELPETAAETFGLWPTPEQFLVIARKIITEGTPEQQQEFAEKCLSNAKAAHDCFVLNHQLDHQRVIDLQRKIEELGTYDVMRFYMDSAADVIKVGVKLAEAKEWCNREDTHGAGWFDGYREHVPGASVTLEVPGA